MKIIKEEASRIIAELKDRNLIDTSRKIDQIGDHVVIPILEKNVETINEIIEIEFDFILHEFGEREFQPSSLKEALGILLPNIPEDHYQTSYDQIGNIAVIDLNYELDEYEEIVGKAIQWSNPSIKSVFSKSSKVSGEFRIRGLDLIAGENNTKTIHKEHGINLVVDINKAYFSPRLATEHNRVAQLIPEHSTVLDMFGSLAPFAFHLTKNKEIEVTTLDNNPEVPVLIRESIQVNKLKGKITIITQDASDYANQTKKNFDYIIMNHPSGAINFLLDAISILSEDGQIFYYDFIPIENFKVFIREKLQEFSVEIDDIHIVRQSSPSEYHICAILSRSSI